MCTFESNSVKRLLITDLWRCEGAINIDERLTRKHIGLSTLIRTNIDLKRTNIDLKCLFYFKRRQTKQSSLPIFFLLYDHRPNQQPIRGEVRIVPPLLLILLLTIISVAAHPLRATLDLIRKCTIE